MSDEVLRDADANMVATWRAVAEAAPSGRAVEDEGIVLLSTGGPIGLLNPAFLVTAPTDIAALVRRVTDHYRSLGLPFALYFRDAVAPGLADACAASDLIEQWRPPLMLLDPIPGSSRDLARNVDISTVDSANLEAYRATLAGGFGMPTALAALVVDEPILGNERFTGFLAAVDSEPAATSALFLTDDIAGIYNVATLPDHRGKGLGAAITWAAAMAGAAAGHTRVILQSSKEGEPVYRRMGFDVLDRYRQFEPK